MFTFLAGLFALGTIGFWVLALAVGIVLTVLVENEEGVWATVVMIGSLIGLNWLYKLPIVDTIKVNPGKTALLLLSYFVLGAVWSLVKWFFFLHKERIKYEDYKADFLTQNNAAALTPELAAKLSGQIGHSNYKGVRQVAPSAREFKGSLTRWATYWPFSIVGTLLNDVVRKVWNYIYQLLQSTYQRMSNYVFRGASADIALAAQFTESKEVEAAAKAGDGPRRVRPNN